MHPTEFDKALRDRYESGSLPPDLAQWEQLARRLEVHEASVLPPARKSRRVAALWPVWTAAAGVLLVGWFFLQRSTPSPLALNTPQQTETPTAPRIISENPPRTPRTSRRQLPAPTASAPPILPASRRLTASAVIPARRRGAPPASPVISPTQNVLSTQQPVAVTRVDKPQPAQIAETPRPAQPYISLASREAQAGAELADGFDPEDEEKRGLGVDLNGGYGPGSLKRNYALGVTVNRKISDRVRVEAGVAVVSGTYETFSASAINTLRPDVAAIPENTTNRLTYIQAAPGVTYEIRSGLFAGAGVDAQRLLSSAESAKGYEYSGERLETQPAWDFGYTLRAGYRLNRNIKAGLQYRNSMHVTAPIAGSAVQPRNYLMFQVGYTIH